MPPPLSWSKLWRWPRRWFWQQPRATPPTPLQFDALLDLPRHSIPLGTDPEEACHLVADALRALPGAQWIDVQLLPRATTIAARAFPPGSSLVPDTPDWPALCTRLEQAARSALPSPRPQPTPPQPAPGFAENMAASPLAAPHPSRLAALDELAALARSFRSSPPPPSPPIGPTPLDELAALARSFRSSPPPPSPPIAPSPAPAPPTPLDELAALAHATRPLHSPKPPASPAPPPTGDDLARLLTLVLPTDAAPVAARAIARFGSYARVLAAPELELRRVPGLGPHSIAAIKLIHEAALRLARARVAERPLLDNTAPNDLNRLADYLAAALARNPIEQFRILFLGLDGMLIADELQAAGTVNHTPVYPREVVRRAIEHRAASLILVHNHPSGDPSPSPADLDMTEQVRRGLDVMGIALHDHVIVGNGRWLSFRDAGLIDPIASAPRPA